MKNNSLKPLSGPQASDALALVHALSLPISADEVLHRLRSAPVERMTRAGGGCSSWSPLIPAIDTPSRHND